MTETPFDLIIDALRDEIPSNIIQYLPDKWEKIGDILTIKLDKKFTQYYKQIGRKYAEFLECKTVLNEVGGITGILREPNVEVIYGSKKTETLHKENGISFMLDPQRIMFSSGNMDERIRMATISSSSETVVDLFAGIGYFSLPLAVYSKPNIVYSCEINPVAYNYLCKNIVLNQVTSTVDPIFGDNRKNAPRDVADRVLMGYLGGTQRFLPVAMDCLKNKVGVIHFHDVFQNEHIPQKPFDINSLPSRIAYYPTRNTFSNNIKALIYSRLNDFLLTFE